ncbi:hypothetical protein M431DRAFT_495644 [Trichoderma harzianum CBS 226.95]|uniref:Uncharacterized protein n=1 Tax=Trichoderma harzianum CBS 226.95 TaxID=983964 RepID=A0A2T4A9B1_TRIHA|nr:hypothetical protein M431DRAFT_495644 [Trichoderma harzianum CBS 226.95]PTB53675.1 hypothetical protein M431DRAFT_495644 [Trichoderma harzianum CBS 226.95]
MLAFGSFAVPFVTVFIGIALGHQTPEHGTLIDPRTRYPANYTLPVQGFPGLQSNWHPRPDCGERSYVGHGRLRGRRALITGGDSGMGRAIAIAFAREGADVAFNYLEVEESDAQETKAFTIPGDLRNESFCADLVHRAAASLGGLDIVVSHAGYALEQAYIGNHSTESFEQTLAAAPLLPPGSSLIFTASDVAVGGNARLVDYAATKAMLVSFTRSLALQLWPFGIRVNAVAPGGTLTNFLTTQGETTESINGAVSLTPGGRLAQPVEVAPTYVDLAEGINSFASGSVYGANGPTGGF